MSNPIRTLVRVISLTVFMGFAANSGYSQSSNENTRLDIPRGESARNYVDHLRFSRIERDIFYIDELNQPIPMNGLPRFRRPEREPEPDRNEPGGEVTMTETTRWVFFAFFAAIVISVVLFAYRMGGGFGNSFRKTDESKARRSNNRNTKTRKSTPQTPADMLLRQLNEMDDKRQALVVLIENLLPAAAHENGIRTARSETAREIIRRIPDSWSYLPELKRIVMTEELVQFGGRDLPERVFEDCLRRAAPILQSGENKVAS